MTTVRLIFFSCIVAILFPITVARADDLADNVSPEIPNYQPVSNLSGALNSAGSSLVTNLINRWSAAFRDIYPAVNITVAGAGSGTALPALLAGTAQLAPMSRPMTADEIAAFHKQFGHDPLRITVGVDALAIFVEKDNPLPAISLKQLDAIFSRSLKRGGPPIRHWSELGIAGDIGPQPIIAFTLTKDSGAAELFKSVAFQDGEFALDLQTVLTTSSAVQGVGADPAAIAFATSLIKTKRTRQVPLLDDSGSPLSPSYENILAGKYPLSRWLYIYVNKPPKQPLNPVIREFLRFAISQEGQRLVARNGNLPLTPEIVKSQLKELDPTAP